MKRSITILVAMGLISSGCISRHVVKNKAQPHLAYVAEEQQTREVDGKPSYYALLPLTVVGDIATCPIQFLYFLFTDDSVSEVTVHGVRVR